MGITISPPRRYAVCVYNATTAEYPVRPAAEVVEFIGPSSPADWVGLDEWRDFTE